MKAFQKLYLVAALIALASPSVSKALDPHTPTYNLLVDMLAERQRAIDTSEVDYELQKLDKSADVTQQDLNKLRSAVISLAGNHYIQSDTLEDVEEKSELPTLLSNNATGQVDQYGNLILLEGSIFELAGLENRNAFTVISADDGEADYKRTFLNAPIMNYHYEEIYKCLALLTTAKITSELYWEFEDEPNLSVNSYLHQWNGIADHAVSFTDGYAQFPQWTFICSHYEHQEDTPIYYEQIVTDGVCNDINYDMDPSTEWWTYSSSGSSVADIHHVWPGWKPSPSSASYVAIQNYNRHWPHPIVIPEQHTHANGVYKTIGTASLGEGKLTAEGFDIKDYNLVFDPSTSNPSVQHISHTCGTTISDHRRVSHEVKIEDPVLVLTFDFSDPKINFERVKDSPCDNLTGCGCGGTCPVDFSMPEENQEQPTVSIPVGSTLLEPSVQAAIVQGPMTMPRQGQGIGGSLFFNMDTRLLDSRDVPSPLDPTKVDKYVSIQRPGGNVAHFKFANFDYAETERAPAVPLTPNAAQPYRLFYNQRDSSYDLMFPGASPEQTIWHRYPHIGGSKISAVAFGACIDNAVHVYLNGALSVHYNHAQDTSTRPREPSKSPGSSPMTPPPPSTKSSGKIQTTNVSSPTTSPSTPTSNESSKPSISPPAMWSSMTLISKSTKKTIRSSPPASKKSSPRTSSVVVEPSNASTATPRTACPEETLRQHGSASHGATASPRPPRSTPGAPRRT